MKSCGDLRLGIPSARVRLRRPHGISEGKREDERFVGVVHWRVDGALDVVPNFTSREVYGVV